MILSEFWKRISVDKEKQQWINDRNNALKELTGKSEDIAELENKYNEVNDYTKLNISNDIDMLKEKRKNLDDIKELKNREKNEEISEKDIESSTLLLEYKPSKNN